MRAAAAMCCSDSLWVWQELLARGWAEDHEDKNDLGFRGRMPPHFAARDSLLLSLLRRHCFLDSENMKLSHNDKNNYLPGLLVSMFRLASAAKYFAKAGSGTVQAGCQER